MYERSTIIFEYRRFLNPGQNNNISRQTQFKRVAEFNVYNIWPSHEGPWHCSLVPKIHEFNQTLNISWSTHH